MRLQHNQRAYHGQAGRQLPDWPCRSGKYRRRWLPRVLAQGR